MKKAAYLALVGLTVAALVSASRRIARHERLIPEFVTRVNTRVTRINQDHVGSGSTGR